MGYSAVAGWLVRAFAKFESTWVRGRAGLSTVWPSRYYRSETFEWRRHFSTAASISRRNDGAFLQRVAAAVTSQVQSDPYCTRLHSNHQIISYAVFCLNKKRLASQWAGFRGRLKELLVFSSLSVS